MHIAKPPIAAHTPPHLLHVADDGGKSAAAAHAVIGKVTATQGEAYIVRGGERIAAKAEAPVYQGDSVETKAGAQISLVFADRETFVLKDKGMMALDEFTYDPVHKTGSATFLIAQGAFTAVSGDLAKTSPDSFHIATPTMVIGVRGTTVSGNVSSDGATSVALLADPGSNFVGEMTLGKLGGGEMIVVNTAGSGVVNATSTSSWSVTPTAAASVAAFAPAAVAPPAVAPSLPAAPATAPGGTGQAPGGTGASQAAAAVPAGTGKAAAAAAPAAAQSAGEAGQGQQGQKAATAESAAAAVVVEPAPPPPPPAGATTGSGSGSTSASASATLGTLAGATVGTSGSGTGGSGTGGTGTGSSGLFNAPPPASAPPPPPQTETNHAPTTSLVTLANDPLNTSVTISKAALLANATDADGNLLTITGVITANHGTVVDNGNGTITFTPTTNYGGPVTFTYTVDDGNGGTAAGTASMMIALPVTVTPSGGSGYEGHPISGTVTGSDANSDVMSYHIVNGGSLTASLAGTLGTLTIDPVTGTYSYAPSGHTVGTDSFTIRVDNGHGTTVDQTVTITLAADPISVGIGGGSGPMGTVITGSVSATDAAGDTLAYALVGANGGAAAGTVAINPSTGAYTYTPSGGSPGTDSFQVSISDIYGDSRTVTVTVTDTLLTQVNSTLHVTTVTPVADSDFAPFNGAATTSLIFDVAAGTQNATLGANAAAAGITTVDATATTGSVTINAAASTQNLIFNAGSGGNVFTGGSGNDTMTGGTGNDTFTGGLGGDTLTGGGGANTFVYTNPTQTTDAMGGRDVITDFVTGTDHIKISLTGTHVDVSTFAPNAGTYNGGQATLTGYTGVSALTNGVVGDGFYSSGDVAFYIYVTGGTTNIGTDGGYVIGSTHQINAVDLQFVITGTSGNDTLVGGVGGDTISGVAGNDHILVTTGALANDVIDGGSGASYLVLTDAGTLTDSAFQHVTNMTGGMQVANGDSLTLGSFWQATGLSSIDASLTTGAVTVDASATTSYAMFVAGSGVDVFTGGSNAGSVNNIYVSTAALANDTFTGGAGYNSLNFTDAGTVADNAFTHVTNMPYLTLTEGDSVTLGSFSQTAGITDINATSTTAGVVMNASGRTDTLNLYGGSGADTFSAGSGTTNMTGNAGADTFVVSATGTAVINDFTANTDNIELDNTKFGLGSTGTLAAGNYATGTSAQQMSATATAYGTAAVGVVVINDTSGPGATLWYTADMSAATTANSHEFAHVTNVNTTALDQAQFHLHV